MKYAGWLMVSVLVFTNMYTWSRLNTRHYELLLQREALYKVQSKASDISARLTELENHIKLNYHEVDATAYTLATNECDADPWLSSFGLSNMSQIAISRDLESRGIVSPGDNILILMPNGKRELRVVNDRLNSRFRNRIDIVMASKKQAYAFGKQQVRILNLTRLNRML